ncbi:PASTA domain-containing protein [Micromonospora terminaliae]|uniref:PASTA domain-containing protein n=1 Tax=Micromonospora terminaliae TaxID=1914461 RepID=A0AAJ3DKT1_9ACTN|nr:PASTA domain-containing protein [Micromonospora terminaliae]NES29658.1 PASTA domain-containing protein [Micromonospora terminaliae]QGL50149.1 PASTA domain-containing protein [Micromonospora terminaliae]
MSDDRQEPPAEDPDATRALPPDRSGADPDATRALPPERPAVPEDADATRAMPREPAGDATRPLPRGEGGAAAGRPVDATSPQQPVSPAWSGRAGVPPPRPAGYPEPGGEWYTEEQAGRRWWMPILLGVLALLLIALIALGVWLALRAADRDAEPGRSPSAVPSTAPQTSATPTTAAPSSSPPSSPPTTTAAAEVPMPPLVGLPESAARAALDRLGVDYRVRYRTSDQPAGTVIDTDPEAGEPVAEGDRVSIVVARAADPTTAAPTSAAPPTATATP